MVSINIVTPQNLIFLLTLIRFFSISTAFSIRAWFSIFTHFHNFRPQILAEKVENRKKFIEGTWRQS
jgi:hypothetical protein